MEGIYAARAVPAAGQLVVMAGLDADSGVALLAFACNDGAYAINKPTTQPTSSSESKMREERAGNIIFLFLHNCSDHHYSIK
jgi:hypothetical protein